MQHNIVFIPKLSTADLGNEAKCSKKYCLVIISGASGSNLDHTVRHNVFRWFLPNERNDHKHKHYAGTDTSLFSSNKSTIRNLHAIYAFVYIYRVSQEEYARLRESVL